MFRSIVPPLVFLSALAAGPGRTEEIPCDLVPGDTSSCVRFIACWGEQGRWLDGQAYGWDQGNLHAVANDGVVCEGKWTTLSGFGGGRADVFCDDGNRVSVLYFSQDPATGTVSGRGMANTGEIVEGWSGEHVLEFFRDGNPAAEAVMQCGDYSIPLS